MQVFHLKTKLTVEELLKSLDSSEAIAIRPDVITSKEEIELAYHLAKKSIENKTNIARNLKYEFLLWLSAKTDIKSAVKSIGPNSSESLLIYFNSNEISKIPNSETKEAKLNPKANPLDLERISLSRIKS